MPTIACPNCHNSSVVDDSVIGRTVRCGACRTAFPAAPATQGEVAPLPKGLIGGRYRLSNELGRGTFGAVYRAADTKLGGREVAVKMLLRDALASSDAIRRFLQEAELLCLVDHPNVVRLEDKGVHGGSHYLVCKLVRGKTLAELMPQQGGFPDPRQVVGWAVTLCRTLHAVYSEHKILHRDVKPANVMLERDHLYLMDFGMAACYDQAIDATGMATTAGTAVGTPAYMPPEQAVFDRDQIGPWSDLYGVAAVLYHLLTGALPVPWRGKLLDILTVAPVPPSRKKPGLDPDLDRIVLKALAKKPADRFSNGDEFAAALRGWLDSSRTSSSSPLPLPQPALPVGSTAKPAIVSPVPSLSTGATPDATSRRGNHKSVAVQTTRQPSTARTKSSPTKGTHTPRSREIIEDEGQNPDTSVQKVKRFVIVSIAAALLATLVALFGFCCRFGTHPLFVFLRGESME